MKRMLAALVGLALFLLPLAALAEEADWFEDIDAFEGFFDDDFEDYDEDNPFELYDDSFDDYASEFDIDPFSAFANDFEIDPFAGFYEDADEGDLFAYAFGYDSPFHDSDGAVSAGAEGTMTATINGEQLVLSFDPSPAFSNVTDTMIQAAFYTYGDATGNLYELYLDFPIAARSGEILTPEYAMQTGAETSVMLVISGADGERYYIASQLGGEVFPRTSSYTIRFDGVGNEGSLTRYSGSVSANMVSYNAGTGEIGDSVSIENASFSFAIAPGDYDVYDGYDDNPFQDLPVAPDPTLPPDYRKV